MKVALAVFPAFTDTHLENQSTHELGQRLEPSVLYMAPEGIGPDNKPYEVEFIETNIPRDDIDLYLCSIYTRGWTEFKAFSNTVGRNKIIAGGYHPTAEPNATLEFAHKVVPGLCGNIEDIIADKNEGILRGIFRPRKMHRELVDMTKMRQVYPDVMPGMMTGSSTSSVGCPFDCNFCATPLMSGKTMHGYDLSSVEEDVASLKKLGVKAVFVRDESFATHKAFFDMVEIYSRGDFKILYSFGTSAAMTDAKFAHLAKHGWHSLNLGLEDVYETYRKSRNLENATEMAQRHGVAINLSFIVNDYGKDQSQALRNYHLLYEAFQKYKPHMVAANFMMPFPGTGIWPTYKDKITEADFVRYDSKTPIFQKGEFAEWHKHMAVAVQLAYYYSGEYRKFRNFENGDNLHLRFVELQQQFGMENGGWTKWFDPQNKDKTVITPSGFADRIVGRQINQSLTV